MLKKASTLASLNKSIEFFLAASDDALWGDS